MSADSADVRPAFAEGNIPVLFAADANYLPYIGVVIASAAANAPGRNLDVLILHNAMPAQTREAFLAGLPRRERVSVRFVDVAGDAMSAAGKAFVPRCQLTSATLYRLFAPWILRSYGKVLYLDADIVVCGDIGELYETDIGGCLFGAVRDAAIGDFAGRRQAYRDYAEREFGFTGWDGYVNAGVMIMDLDAFRRGMDMERLLSVSTADASLLYDQDALNFLAGDRVRRLPAKWNYLAVGRASAAQNEALAGERPAVLHFVGTAKPWNRPETPHSNVWWSHVPVREGASMWRAMFGVADLPSARGDGIAVSVVVPVYNAEPYLAQMLVALAAQTLENIEVICVDDGSTDGSRAVCERFAAADPRFRVVVQGNGGGAVARNRGMSEAKGRWLFFADADDFCRPDMLAEMLERGESAAADVVVAGRYFLDSRRPGSCTESGYPSAYRTETGVVNSGTESFDVFSGNGFAPWNKLYRAAFVRRTGVTFHQIPPNDDVFFVLVTLVEAERIALMPRAFYYYRRFLPTSQMGRVDSHPLNFLTALREVRDRISGREFALRRRFVRAAISSCFDNLFRRTSSEAASVTYDALVNGGFRAMEFDDIPAGSVSLGRFAEPYALASRGAGLWEVAAAYYTPRQTALESENAQLRERNREFAAKIESLRAANEEKKRLLAEAAATRRALSEKVESLRAANEEKKRLLAEAAETRRALAEKVESLRAANEAKKKTLAENRERISALQSAISKIEKVCS